MRKTLYRHVMPRPALDAFVGLEEMNRDILAEAHVTGENDD